MLKFLRIFLCALLLTVSVVPPMQAVPKPPAEVEKGCMHYIDKYLKIFTNLTSAEVLTVIDVESGFHVDLIADEPKVHDKSYGPMQVRAKTAKEMGLKGDPTQLCTWEVGLYYGMQYLSWSKEKAVKSTKNETVARKRTWAGYNASDYYLIRKPNGEWTYVNSGYVKKCERTYPKYTETELAETSYCK